MLKKCRTRREPHEDHTRTAPGPHDTLARHTPALHRSEKLTGRYDKNRPSRSVIVLVGPVLEHEGRPHGRRHRAAGAAH